MYPATAAHWTSVPPALSQRSRSRFGRVVPHCNDQYALSLSSFSTVSRFPGNSPLLFPAAVTRPPALCFYLATLPRFSVYCATLNCSLNSADFLVYTVSRPASSQPLTVLRRCDSGHGLFALAAVPACPDSVSSDVEQHALGFFGSTLSHTMSAATALLLYAASATTRRYAASASAATRQLAAAPAFGISTSATQQFSSNNSSAAAQRHAPSDLRYALATVQK